MTGARVIRLALLAAAALIAIDLLITGRLGALFDVGFIALCIATALMVRPTEFFKVAVLPPILLLVVCAATAIVHRAGVAAADDGFVQAIVSGLAHHSGALFAGTINAILVMGIRTRVRTIRLDRIARARSPYNVRHAAHSKRAASPEPYLVTSATPEEKSTTVVGSAETVPESRTASSF